MSRILFIPVFVGVIIFTRAVQMPADCRQRDVLPTQLPTDLQASFQSTYAGYEITGLTEAGANQHVMYTCTMESSKKVLHLQAGGSGPWKVVEAIEKNGR